jgi:hypothetical protein
LFYTEAIIKHHFNVSVNSEEELLKWFSAYRRMKQDEENSMVKLSKNL